MSVSVQQRGLRFQLRVRDKLLPRPFFFTFATEAEARTYGNQLKALLTRGIVPVELLARPAAAENPLLIEVIRAYVKNAPHLTDSDDALLGTMLPELAGARLGDVTYAWAERYVGDLKVRQNFAPGTIRKRIGALGRVVDWHLRSTESTAGNALRLLPAGYSQYTASDKAKLPLAARPKIDVKRDRRLAPDEEARIRPHLGELELLYEVIVDTGVRLREGYMIRTERLDIKRGLLHVDGTKGVRGALKPRTVPLKPRLAKLLVKHCKGRVGLIFPWWDGDPASLKAVTSRLSYLFSKAFAEAGVLDLSEHDLRHEATCRWFEHRTGAGWTFSEIEVCRIMGWSSPAMALRYASIRGEDLAARLR